MAGHHHCANGHQWDESSSLAAATPVCPECGHQNGSERGDAQLPDELPPAPKPPPGLSPISEPASGGLRFPEIPGYEILRELGRGGMGVVFQARDVRLHRLVALKMILSGFHATPETLIRFLGEAKVVARLQHPNIVQIFDIGDWGGQPYLALEYLEGGNLARLLGQPLSADVAVPIAETLARAVQYAHEQGVVHRDLKPSNILMSQAGYQFATAMATPPRRASTEPLFNRKPTSANTATCDLKITDFGLAKRLDADAGTTNSGSVVGTPHYMPPEQAAGRTHEVGPANDVYAIGAILYEMLTGRPPIVGTTPMETVMHVLNDDPAPPRMLNARISRDLETICLKCLRKEPRQRYASAADVADDLHRFACGEPIRARPIAWWERAWRWAQRNPLAAVLASAFLASLVLGVVIATYFAVQSERRAVRLFDMKRASDRHLYLARANLAMQAWQEGGIDRVLKLLAAMRPESTEGGEDLRGFEWHHLWYLCHRDDRRVVQAHDGQVNGVAWSSDVKVVASAGNDKLVKLWAAATGELLAELRGHEHSVQCVAFAPDGRMVASSDAGGFVRIWDVARHQPIIVLEGSKSPSMAVAFSPDGRWLAASSGLQLRRWRTSDWHAEVWSGANDAIDAIAWSGNSSRFYAVGKDDRLMHWDVDSPEGVVGAGFGAPIRSLALTHDGGTLAAGSSKGETHLRTVGASDDRRLLPGLAEDLQAIDFSRDGKFLISGGVSGAVKVRNLTSDTARVIAHTGPVQSFAVAPDERSLLIGGLDGKIKFANLDLRDSWPSDHAGKIYGLAISPEGTQVASASQDGSVRVWQTKSEKLEAEPLNGRVPLWSVAFSPDGRRLAYGDNRGRVHIWNRHSRSEETAWAGHPEAVRGLAFSPDGRWLATAGYTDARIRLWDVGGKALKDFALPSDRAWCVAFSPDGRWLAAGGSQGNVTVWDVESGAVGLAVHAGMGWVWTVAFSPDSAEFAAAAEDGRIFLWNVRDGRLTQTLSGHSSLVRSLGFFPDGQSLYCGNNDGTIRLWDRISGEERSALRGHRDAVWAVVVTPDGQTLISAGYDKSIHYWRTATSAEVYLDRTPAIAPSKNER
jgi:WD40 repeat protein